MIKSAATFKRKLARDTSEKAAMAAQVGRIWPERQFITFRTSFKVPVALDRPADEMAVLVVIIGCGGNRAFGFAFSLS